MSLRKRKFNRRQFVAGVGAGVTAFTIIPRHVLGGEGQAAANDKINIASVGCGGRGWSDISGVKSENIVALCDVDQRQTGRAKQQFPAAKQFTDFRKMFDDVEKQIDAVTIGIPDHSHAAVCMDAIRRGKHVYCEKPLAHSIFEIRTLQKAVKEHKVITQVGNQGHSSETIRMFCEWIWDGAIGKVTEVHAACNAFPTVYSQIRNLEKVNEQHDVPAELDWDLWLGPAKFRPYNPMYCPWNWRGWMDFGTGGIGDWICHVVDPSFWALDLGAPVSVEAEVDGYDPKIHAAVYPPGTQVTYEFAAKGDRGPVKLVWYDGSKKPPRPKDLEEGRDPPGTGAIVIGTEGTITHGSHGGGGVRLVPETKMQAYQQPEKTIPRVPGHHEDWLIAMREGRQSGSNFDYGGSLTELGLLGAIAIKYPGVKLAWDTAATRFTNNDEANQYVNPPYRQGWTL
ncbi:MAG TPA: Gfo/Idh/MocA family oxidoreductase [Thermoguttaceae bacterium]|nr:Gfo/Idh/MocA family oxidoreductase [Thermoguttaceae bacterium]